jgi:hypothetical protein
MRKARYQVMSQRYDSEEPTPIGPCFATYDEAADYCINEAMPYVKEFGERFADNAPVWIVPGEDVRLDFSGSVLDRDTAQAEIGDRLTVTLTVIRKVYPVRPRVGYASTRECEYRCSFAVPKTVDDAVRIDNMMELLRLYADDDLDVITDIAKVQAWLSAQGYGLGNVIIKNVGGLFESTCNQ